MWMENGLRKRLEEISEATLEVNGKVLGYLEGIKDIEISVESEVERDLKIMEGLRGTFELDMAKTMYVPAKLLQGDTIYGMDRGNSDEVYTTASCCKPVELDLDVMEEVKKALEETVESRKALEAACYNLDKTWPLFTISTGGRNCGKTAGMVEQYGSNLFSLPSKFPMIGMPVMPGTDSGHGLRFKSKFKNPVNAQAWCGLYEMERRAYVAIGETIREQLKKEKALVLEPVYEVVSKDIEIIKEDS